MLFGEKSEVAGGENYYERNFDDISLTVNENRLALSARLTSVKTRSVADG